MKNGSIFARFVISHRTTLILLRRIGRDHWMNVHIFVVLHGVFLGLISKPRGGFRRTPDPSGVMTEKKNLGF